MSRNLELSDEKRAPDFHTTDTLSRSSPSPGKRAVSFIDEQRKRSLIASCLQTATVNGDTATTIYALAEANRLRQKLGLSWAQIVARVTQ